MRNLNPVAVDLRERQKILFSRLMDRMDNYKMSDGMERLVENLEQNILQFCLACSVHINSLVYEIFNGNRLFSLPRGAVIDINNSSVVRSSRFAVQKKR